ncbi:MAG TPA: cupin domain-containing protein [Actinomycetota bacterium]|nr:cupin domain-containing protein [Actinomycetota bacterium]
MSQAAPRLAVGQKIRSLREERGRSLREISENAGVSESFLSQVERGVASPSVASLRRIAEALGTSIVSFFEGPAEVSGRIVRASSRRRLIHPQRDWEDHLLTPGEAKRLQIILSTIEPGAGSGDEPYGHESDEECVIVLKGQLEFWVDQDRFELAEGDSLLFESRRPHRNRNPGPGKAEVLWVLTPPSY